MSDFYELDIDEKVEDYNFDSSISFYQVKNPNWQYFKDNVAPDYLKLTNKNIVEQQKVYAFVAKDELGFVGNIFFTPSPGAFDSYRLIQIKIVYEYRERGLGTAFYNYAVAELKKEGVKHIEAFCMEDEAEEYLPFLEKNQFVKNDYAYISKYTTEQLCKVKDKMTGAVSKKLVKMADLSTHDIYKYLGPENISIDGIDRSMSALVISEDRYAGIAIISCTNGKPKIEGVYTKKELVKPIDILAIWKYVLETVIDLAGKSEKNIDDIEIQIYQYQDILRDIFGTPVENNEVTIFSKEI